MFFCFQRVIYDTNFPLLSKRSKFLGSGFCHIINYDNPSIAFLLSKFTSTIKTFCHRQLFPATSSLTNNPTIRIVSPQSTCRKRPRHETVSHATARACSSIGAYHHAPVGGWSVGARGQLSSNAFSHLGRPSPTSFPSPLVPLFEACNYTFFSLLFSTTVLLWIFLSFLTPNNIYKIFESCFALFSSCVSSFKSLVVVVS